MLDLSEAVPSLPLFTDAMQDGTVTAGSLLLDSLVLRVSIQGPESCKHKAQLGDAASLLAEGMLKQKSQTPSRDVEAWSRALDGFGSHNAKWSSAPGLCLLQHGVPVSLPPQEKCSHRAGVWSSGWDPVGMPASLLRVPGFQSHSGSDVSFVLLCTWESWIEFLAPGFGLA